LQNGCKDGFREGCDVGFVGIAVGVRVGIFVIGKPDGVKVGVIDVGKIEEGKSVGKVDIDGVGIIVGGADFTKYWRIVKIKNI